MRIPEIRSQLSIIADGLREKGMGEECERLLFLVTQLYRRRPVRRAPIKARSCYEPGLREKAIEMALLEPETPYREIGARLGIDGGRISEFVAGYRA